MLPSFQPPFLLSPQRKKRRFLLSWDYSYLAESGGKFMEDPHAYGYSTTEFSWVIGFDSLFLRSILLVALRKPNNNSWWIMNYQNTLPLAIFVPFGLGLHRIQVLLFFTIWSQKLFRDRTHTHTERERGGKGGGRASIPIPIARVRLYINGNRNLYLSWIHQIPLSPQILNIFLVSSEDTLLIPTLIFFFLSLSPLNNY